MCPPFVSLLVSALFRWLCSISIHLSPRSVTAGVRPFPLAMRHFYSFVSQVSALSAGHVAFLFICLAGLFMSLLVSAHFRWPCSISIHLSPGLSLLVSGVRPFPLSPFILSLSPVLYLCPSCLPSVIFCLPFCLPSFLPSCWSSCPPCLPSCPSLFPVLSPFSVVTASCLSAFCYLLSPFLLVIVSGLVPNCCWSLCPSCLPSVSFCLPSCPLVGHCVRLVSRLVSLCLRSCPPSCWSLCPSCLPSVPFFFLLVSLLVGHWVHCVRLVSLLSPFFSGLVSLLSGHCVRFVSLCFLLSPFLSPFLFVILSVLSPFLMMSQKVDLGMLRCCLTCLGSTVV